MANVKGDVHSSYELGLLNRKTTDRDLILATMNPLVESLNSTDAQMTLSKPFWHTVYDKKHKVDIELSHDIADCFENINFFDWVAIAKVDSFNMGRGIDEIGWAKDDSGYVNFNLMERRPTDTFKRPSNTNIRSTSQRWKGIYIDQGILHFDQTISSYSKKSGSIVSLDPKQVFSISPLTARFPDGPSTLEFLIPFLDGAQLAFDMIFVVMQEQLNPEEIMVEEDQPGDDEILRNLTEKANTLERMGIPSNMEILHPRYFNRLDVNEFYNHFVKEMYKIVFPVSALSSEKAGGILDNSSNLVKAEIFFNYIQANRLRICRETRAKGNLWLDINGFKKQGYTYELVPAPIQPKNTEIETKIMNFALQYSAITPKEYRSWVNSSVIGIKLEENFDESQVGMKVQPLADQTQMQQTQKTVQKMQAGDPEAIIDLLAERAGADS